MPPFLRRSYGPFAAALTAGLASASTLSSENCHPLRSISKFGHGSSADSLAAAPPRAIASRHRCPLIQHSAIAAAPIDRMVSPDDHPFGTVWHPSDLNVAIKFHRASAALWPFAAARSNDQHTCHIPLRRTGIDSLSLGLSRESLTSHAYAFCAAAPANVSETTSHTNAPPASSCSAAPSFIPHDISLHERNHHDQVLIARPKPTVVVVLLGWLGAQQKHLKKYADFYTSRGIHAVTFSLPMKDLLPVRVAQKIDDHVDTLSTHLTQWLNNDDNGDQQGGEKVVIFHTFSNTGWLIYGAVLERLIDQGHGNCLQNIKGCVVDSAPWATPDPHAWALGFSAALLKKDSIATQKIECNAIDDCSLHPKPSLKETALIAVLEKVCSVFLQLPYVDRRLSGVVSVLSTQQPKCPQLYLYSTADTVIPAGSVEEFIEKQRKLGQTVISCNFQLSPHVDHFRTFPEQYNGQLKSFLGLCLAHCTSGFD